MSGKVVKHALPQRICNKMETGASAEAWEDFRLCSSEERFDYILLCVPGNAMDLFSGIE